METDQLTERGLTPSPVGSHENLFPVPQRPPVGTNVNGPCTRTLYSEVNNEGNFKHKKLLVSGYPFIDNPELLRFPSRKSISPEGSMLLIMLKILPLSRLLTNEGKGRDFSR